MVEYDKNRIIFKLVNTEKNKEMLLNVPHRAFNDLSVVYGLLDYDDDGFPKFTSISNAILNEFNISENQLYEDAYENTRKILSPQTGIVNVGPLGEEEKLSEIQAVPMGIITNEFNFYGAAMLLYDDVVQEHSLNFGDMYILPSSIDEVFTVSAKLFFPNDLVKMVKEINQNLISPEKFLSDSVYFYDQKERKVTLVANVVERNASVDERIDEAEKITTKEEGASKGEEEKIFEIDY